MRSLMTVCCIAGLFASAPYAGAQTATIDPGMTRDQVIAKLGEPLSAHAYDGSTFMLYKNGCEKTCGMNDLVVLDSGKVVDAIFRSPARHYSGTSSSPHMIPASVAKRGAAAASKAPLTIKPPAPKKPADA